MKNPYKLLVLTCLYQAGLNNERPYSYDELVGKFPIPGVTLRKYLWRWEKRGIIKSVEIRGATLYILTEDGRAYIERISQVPVRF